MSSTKKAQWLDVIGPANDMSRAAGNMRPRRLADMPEMVTPGAKQVALVTLFAREQDFAYKPVMEALLYLSKLKDWSGEMLVATEAHPHFDWRTQPWRRYASFKDFYSKELENTWGSWEDLQAEFAEVAAGHKTEADVESLMRVKASSRARVTDAAKVTTGEVLPARRPKNSERAMAASISSEITNLPQAARAKAAGVSKSQQERLDTLARKAPSLFAQVQSGTKSTHKACVEAGIVKPPTPFVQVKRLWPKLSPEEKDEIRRMP